MVLPPLAILIPRIIRVLELLVELYSIFAPCLACALRGCFGGCFGCGRKKKPDDDCQCPPPEEQKRRSCFLKKSNSKKDCVGHEDGNGGQKEGKKPHWYSWSGKKGNTLCNEPPGNIDRDVDLDTELVALQRQYSSLPQPPPAVHHHASVPDDAADNQNQNQDQNQNLLSTTA